MAATAFDESLEWLVTRTPSGKRAFVATICVRHSPRKRVRQNPNSKHQRNRIRQYPNQPAVRNDQFYAKCERGLDHKMKLYLLESTIEVRGDDDATTFSEESGGRYSPRAEP